MIKFKILLQNHLSDFDQTFSEEGDSTLNKLGPFTFQKGRNVFFLP